MSRIGSFIGSILEAGALALGSAGGADAAAEAHGYAARTAYAEAPVMEALEPRELLSVIPWNYQEYIAPDWSNLPAIVSTPSDNQSIIKNQSYGTVKWEVSNGSVSANYNMIVFAKPDRQIVGEFSIDSAMPGWYDFRNPGSPPKGYGMFGDADETPGDEGFLGGQEAGVLVGKNGIFYQGKFSKPLLFNGGTSDIGKFNVIVSANQLSFNPIPADVRIIVPCFNNLWDINKEYDGLSTFVTTTDPLNRASTDKIYGAVKRTDGVELVPEGWKLMAFDNDGQPIGFTTITDTGSYGMVLFGDLSSTPEDDGGLIGSNIDYLMAENPQGEFYGAHFEAPFLLDGNGDVNLKDIFVDMNPQPEPATIALLGAGAAGLALARRKKGVEMGKYDGNLLGLDKSKPQK